MARDTVRVQKLAEEKVLDDDDIIATMVMVSAESGSEVRGKSLIETFHESSNGLAST